MVSCANADYSRPIWIIFQCVYCSLLLLFIVIWRCCAERIFDFWFDFFCFLFCLRICIEFEMPFSNAFCRKFLNSSRLLLLQRVTHQCYRFCVSCNMHASSIIIDRRATNHKHKWNSFIKLAVKCHVQNMSRRWRWWRRRNQIEQMRQNCDARPDH